MTDNRFMTLRFPDDERARDFVLAAHGGDAYEAYESVKNTTVTDWRVSHKHCFYA